MAKMIISSVALSLLLILAGCGAAETFSSPLQEVMLTIEATPLASTPAGIGAPEPTQAPVSNRLTAAQAKAIALEHAGIHIGKLRQLTLVQLGDESGLRHLLHEVVTGNDDVVS
jgi:enhancing lycopene biosynthesis protein 2